MFFPSAFFFLDAMPPCNANFTSKSFLVLCQLYSQASFWGNGNWEESEAMLVHNSSNYIPRKKDNVCQSLSSLMILRIILLAIVSLLLKRGLTNEIILFKIFGWVITLSHEFILCKCLDITFWTFFFSGNRDNWNISLEIGTSSKLYCACWMTRLNLIENVNYWFPRKQWATHTLNLCHRSVQNMFN